MGVLIIILAVLVVLVFADGQVFSTYRTQWEVTAEVVAFDVAGEVTNPPPTVNPPPTSPPTTEPSPGEWVPPGGWEREPGVPGRFTVYRFPVSSSIQYDFDNSQYGMPDIKVVVGDIREEKSKFPYAPLENKMGNFTYITEYHEYLFDVQIGTVAGVTKSGDVWLTETAMPYERYDSLLGGSGDRIGKPFDGKVYIRFVTSPWGMPDFGLGPENYTFNGYWLGIMNSKCEDCEYGQAVENIEEVHKGWVRAVMPKGEPLNMMQDDGKYALPYNKVPWDSSKILDPDIKSNVVLEIPINMLAGAFDRYDFWKSAIIEVRPIDYSLTYTIRMECLVTREYEFRDPATPANPSPIEKRVDWVPTSAATFWDRYGMWIIIGAIILIIIMILAAWLGLPVWFMMMRR
jgi:hypothetical protein